MKVAIMQPYLFPYIGYFQLIRSCKVFIFLDNVQFISRGWIHRNQILINGKKHVFTIPLVKNNRYALIHQRKISQTEYRSLLLRFFKSLLISYQHSPYYDQVLPLIETVFDKDQSCMSKLAQQSVKNVCKYLKLPTEFYQASDLMSDAQSQQMTGQERILALAKSINANHYINPIGGANLYQADAFHQQGINLSWLTSQISPYPQHAQEFVPSLSIIDVLMHNDIQTINDMINTHQLTEAKNP